MFNCKKFCAEFLGTMLLVFFGCGVAMTMGVNRLTYVAVALAFGLSIVAIAAFIGDISGCHINPAVSLGMLLDGRMKLGEFFYIYCRAVPRWYCRRRRACIDTEE